MLRCLCYLTAFLAVIGTQTQHAVAGVKTWDGRHSLDQIDVTLVYFVPSDVQPLVDWRDRVDYFARRLELFHEREFTGQSTLKANVLERPFVSKSNTAELRRGEADPFFFRTLREVDDELGVSKSEGDAFPILLVLSDINWRPLDDFYRLRPDGHSLVFEGTERDGEHFPGAKSGGSRATYISDRRVGWGLVTADGWRVPYRGSDCVIYHEGSGHTIGLPHPEPQNGSVMSVGQYRGWINESWLDKEQKLRLGWEPAEATMTDELELFNAFTATPTKQSPQPGEPVDLKLELPDSEKVTSIQLRYQTSLWGPWIDAKPSWRGDRPETLRLGVFDRPTPISYRVNVELENGAESELWGYLQVRSDPGLSPQPHDLSPDLVSITGDSKPAVLLSGSPPDEVDVLALFDIAKQWHNGRWSITDGDLVCEKSFGARIELPVQAPEEYRLTIIAEPLDEPNGLTVGHVVDGHRFLTLFNFRAGGDPGSAIENVDGRNIGNDTTYRGSLFHQGRPSQIVVTVRKGRVSAEVDGRPVIDWAGGADRLSLSDYWQTPDQKSLFLGTYDCGYRFSRITLEPLK